MLPFDILEGVYSNLRDSKENKGQLYAGSHLTGSLRHAMLDAANAPRKPRSLVEDITLKTGDMWHEWLTSQIGATGWPFMSEVRLSDYMPEGWGGRADWILYNPARKGWVLGDIKTTTGDGIYWINRDGAKENHLWQLSAYWHACLAMGLPMIRGFFVLYWPKGAASSKDAVVEASIQECDPYPEEKVIPRMEERWALTSLYLDSVAAERARFSFETGGYPDDYPADLEYLTDSLAPPQEREQKVQWDYSAKNFAVKLVPHWSTRYCPFELELCDCSTQGTTKIGHYELSGEYVSRKGYEGETPLVTPSEHDYNKRRREVARSATSSND